jgi:hypothetical protein
VEARTALGRIKMTTDVPSQLRKKAELEDKLTKLEAAIKIFSQPRVFVRL